MQFRVAIKRFLWRPALRILQASGLKAGLILLYHDIGDRDGDPQRELVAPISRRQFAKQLEHLLEYYQFVDLMNLQAAAAARRRGDPFPLALTFDDDLGHHVTHALPELQKAGAPATFFLCGSFFAELRDYWWQRLQRASDLGADASGLLGTGTIHQQGEIMKGMAPELRDSAAEKLGALAGQVPIEELLSTQGARRLPRIGFHTVRHDPLTGLDDEQLISALSDGRDSLAELAGRPLDAIAYPHGDFDSRVVAAARQSGFTIGVTCERQAVTPDADPLVLGRHQPAGRTSIEEFAFDLVRTLLISPA